MQNLCRTCGETGHPFFRCPQKESDRKCFRCKSPSHLTKDCLNEVVCHFCLEKGHKKSECEEYIHSKDRELYGRYTDEIREGRKADKEEGRARLLDDVRMTLNFSHTDTENDIDHQTTNNTHDIRANENNDNENNADERNENTDNEGNANDYVNTTITDTDSSNVEKDDA